jgi:hypothetical protein
MVISACDDRLEPMAGQLAEQVQEDQVGKQVQEEDQLGTQVEEPKDWAISFQDRASKSAYFSNI